MSEETESCPATESGNDNATEDTSEPSTSPEKTEAQRDRGDSVGANNSEKKKIDVLLKATGDAPIMLKRKWAVSPTSKVMDIVDFVRRYLKLEQSESLGLFNYPFLTVPDCSRRCFQPMSVAYAVFRTVQECQRRIIEEAH